MSPRSRRARASQASGSPPPRTSATGIAWGGVLDDLPAAIALTLVAAIPAYINLASDQIFEEQKSLLLLAGVIVALPGALYGWWRGDGRVARRPIVLAFVALVVLLFIAAWADGFIRDAIVGAHRRRHGLLMWTALAVIFVVMGANSRTEEWRRRLALALILGSVWPSIYALVQKSGGDPFAWTSPAFYTGSTFGNPVLFAGYLSVVIPVTMMYALRVNRWWMAVAVLQCGALIASGSRGGALAAGASALVFAVVYHARELPRRTVLLRLIGVSVAGLLLVAVPPVRDTVARAVNASNASARVRIVIWQDVLSLVRASGPRMLIGHGPESLRRVILPHYSSELGALEQQDAMPDRAHNELLDTLVTAGIAGVILQLAFFGMAFWAALGIKSPALRAGLAAAVVAHLVELQFGIASVGSRLNILAVAALIVGWSSADTARSSARRLSSGALLLVVLVAALSPVISILPNRFAIPQATGTPDDLVEYVRGLANGTLLLYGALVIAALAIARTSAGSGYAGRFTLFKAAGVAAAVAAVIPLSLQPAFADTFASAGATFESKAQWTAAVIAYREACRRAPQVAYYRSNLGRALIQRALRSATTPDELARELGEAESTYRAALAMEPFDPDHSRHLAALFRIRASRSAPPQQAEWLAAADRIYAEITAKVPNLTSLWFEWAYVDLDRHLPEKAIEKLDRALTLDAGRADARQLRSEALRTLGRPASRRD